MPERSVKHDVTHFCWVGAGYISRLNPVWSCCGYSGPTHLGPTHIFFSIILNPLTPSHCGPIKIPPVPVTFMSTPFSIQHDMSSVSLPLPLFFWLVCSPVAPQKGNGLRFTEHMLCILTPN